MIIYIIIISIILAFEEAWFDNQLEGEGIAEKFIHSLQTPSRGLKIAGFSLAMFHIYDLNFIESLFSVFLFIGIFWTIFDAVYNVWVMGTKWYHTGTVADTDKTLGSWAFIFKGLIIIISSIVIWIA